MTTITAPDHLSLTMWRDPDDDVLALPGIAMGTLPGVGDPSELASRLYRDGVRRVELSRPVDLSGGMDHRTLVWSMLLLRELTSWGIAVDWQLRPGEHAEVWQRLNHLYPPAALLGHPDADEVLTDWRETFYLCKCVFRRGPGFVEVRDRRNASLSRFIVDDPEYLAAIEALINGVLAADVSQGVLREFVDEGLAGVAGDLAWWLPYRVRRWPWPSMIV
ncbi:MAG: DUF5825 family protein [Jatrophihabitantaceae bacterium]